MAYARIEPFGFEMENWRAGLIASTTANVTIGGRGRRLKPSDFYPKIEGTTGGLTERQERELEQRRSRKKGAK